ncbi:hypothetical protein GCM10023263_56980 [Phytohabitans rumicis]
MIDAESLDRRAGQGGAGAGGAGVGGAERTGPQGGPYWAFRREKGAPLGWCPREWVALKAG